MGDMAMTLQDFINDLSNSPHDFEPREAEYTIVAWNGKKRVPLVLDGIDHEKKVIVLTTEPLTPYSEVTTLVQQLDLPVRDDGTYAEVRANTKKVLEMTDAQRAELERRMLLDHDSKIETLQDAEAYMADVLARGPFEEY